MKAWTIAGALMVAGAMLAGSATGQTTTPSEPKDKPTTGGAAGTSESMKTGDKPSDAMKSDRGTTSDAAKGQRSGRMAGGNKERVKAAQQALKDKGHDPGPVDGVMGPKTQAALKDFQSKEGITATGQLDAETMSKLGVQARAGAAADRTGSPAASPGTGSAPSPGAGGAASGTPAPGGSTPGASAPSTPGGSGTTPGSSTK
jgi:peptidoglycan hydrolase-like protein with peptidoglycan-binding domain